MRRLHDIAGFTLVELVAVIAIIGILGAVAGPRFFATTPFETRGFVAESMAALGYAQKLAVASGCSIRVDFSAAGYQIERWTNPADCNDRGAARVIIARPDGTPFQANAPGSVAVSSLAFYFDRIGRPRDAGTGALIGNAAALIVNVATYAIQVEPETGYVRQL